MTDPRTRQPWDDDRLDAAFAARARSVSTPAHLIATTIRRLGVPAGRTRSRPGGWPLLAAAAVVLIVVAGSIGVGTRLISSGGDPAGAMRVVDGPTPDLRTLDAAEFAFDFPAEWLVYDASATGSGVSSIAILGTQAVERRCGDVRHVDINCAYEQRLEPGGIRVIVGTGAYRGGTVLDRADIENGTTTRHTVAEMPAILDIFDVQPDSYYREDLSLLWSIGRPGLLSNVVTIEVRAREGDGPGTRVADAAQATTDAIIASFRFTGAQTPSPEPATTDTFGLPVISVVEALAARDAGVDDRELAVRGWFSPIPPIGCPAPATWPVTPVEPNCPDQWVVLMQEPESLATVSADGLEGHAPTGPSFQVDLDDLDLGWAPGLPAVGAAVPVEIVVIGHFDDRRSFACPVDVQAACRERFVVDRIDSVDSRRLSTSVIDLVDAGTVSTSDDVERLVLAAAPGSATLSIAAVDGNPGLGRIEPAFGTGQAGLIDHRAIWSVRVLLDGRSVTYLVVDGTDAVFAIDADNVATQVAGARPTPSATTPSVPTASPSFTSDGFRVFEVELLSPVGAGRPRPIVTVVDKAGFVAAVREVGPEDRPMGDDRSNIFDRDPDVDGRYRLFWPGSLCDREITVTIEPGAARIVVDQGARDACDALGVGRELVLDLTRSVDTTGVEVVVVPPTRAGASAFEVEFTSPLHGGLGGPRITVVDRSGRLRAAREVGADDGPFPGDRSTGNVYVANGAPNVLRVQWIGGLCDAGMTMTIDDGVTDSIAIESGVVEDCDSRGVTRELVLTFDGPIAAASMRARLAYP